MHMYNFVTLLGRHPSGQHQQQPVQAPLRQTHSANVSLLANSAYPRPELSTEFIPWSARYFTKQLMKHDCIECDCDHESTRHWSREWMFNRNARTRSKADQEYTLLRNKMAKLDASLHPNLAGATPVIRCKPQTTSRVIFHPFDPIMFAAGNNVVNILNPQYGSMGKIDSFELPGKAKVNVTSMELVNAHDEPVLLVGYANGGIVVLRDFANQSRSSMRMVAAWNGLRELESHRRLQTLSSAASLMASTAPSRYKTSLCRILCQETKSFYILDF